MSPVSAMTPVRYRVAARQRETTDTVTLDLDPVGPAIDRPRPGQYTMLYGFGTGEIPVSVSGCPDDEGYLRHTIRGVGEASRGLVDLPVGSMLGVRGPFGTGWALDRAAGRAVVVVAGGIGLAPMRPVIRHLVAHRHRYGHVAVLVGARRPEELLYRAELSGWRSQGDLHTVVTVDIAGRNWDGSVGVVTGLIPEAIIEAEPPVAFVCGPEVMIRMVARDLVDQGVSPTDIWVSLERNMHCAIGHCGHCQLGPLFVCTDGPVVSWAAAQPLLEVRQW